MKPIDMHIKHSEFKSVAPGTSGRSPIEHDVFSSPVQGLCSWSIPAVPCRCVLNTKPQLSF